MSSFLPQQDPNPRRRQRALGKNQAKYTYNYSHVSPLAILDRVPVHDEFSYRWLFTVAERVLVALANRAELAACPHHRDHHLTQHKLLHRIMSVGESAVRNVTHMVTEALRFEPRVGAHPERPESLEDYEDLFRTIGLPPVTHGCQNDKVFAWMRVAGPNPLVIRRLSEPHPRLNVTETDFKVSCPDDSLDAALHEGRLYIADYALLNVESTNVFPHGQKHMYAPLAMFVVERNTGDLVPVAIQCRQDPASDNPVFTPNDGYNWLIAKTVVEMADGNLHEAFSHLGRTHLLMEPFAVTTRRQLAPTHPLALLLEPHFEGTMAINEAAWRHLVANKGAVEKLCSAPIGAARDLAAAGVQTAMVSDMMLPDTFVERGVDDPSLLPHYPYRDDSLLYWEAINNWVKQYLEVYYPTDIEVIEDTELQAWGRELASKEGGRVSGMPGDGQFRTREELVNVITLVIYTCSVQHAAVNFPQYDLMSYVPNMPLSLYAQAPTTKTGATEQDYLNMLPTMDMVELQMELGYMLGGVHYTQLGKYPWHHFRDHRIAEPLKNFQHDISNAGGQVVERNNHRQLPYATLEPSGIPQSINI